ncbi:hypothetical protein CVT24_012379 [Panaeolus cyanescens]|uniref:Uncharacterized protein n=1 Tax=Panaeolus cyanescens TaxID=181874 RepID=A0A409YYM9_9AGAR|nr:hypothetical protein CVT24_012379 [Panaeolus cyanescens]
MAIRSSISIFLAISSLTLVNSVPIAIPMPIVPGVSRMISERHADPLPTFPNIANEVGNSFSGGAGQAEGGSVAGTLPIPADASLLGLDNLHLISLGSHNGGDAGIADSGPSIPASNAHVSVKYPSAIKEQMKNAKQKLAVPNVTNSIGNAYSGWGGNANGGSAVSSGAVIDLLSGNAGNGNSATSGASGLGLAGLPLMPANGHAAVTYHRPRSIAFRKHAVNRNVRLSRMVYPYR